MSRYRSPYTGRMVSAATHGRQVAAAETRQAKWEHEKTAVARRLNRLKEGGRAYSKAERRMGEVLHNEYVALQDLAKLREQEEGGVAAAALERLDDRRRHLAGDYEDFGVPILDEEMLDDVEGVEFELRAESEGDTGEVAT